MKEIKSSLREFNWDKKISLKEIAQYYEDRIRELDARYQEVMGNFKDLSNKYGGLLNKYQDLIDKQNNIIDKQKIIDDKYDKYTQAFKNETMDWLASMFPYVLSILKVQSKAYSIMTENTKQVYEFVSDVVSTMFTEDVFLTAIIVYATTYNIDIENIDFNDTNFYYAIEKVGKVMDKIHELKLFRQIIDKWREEHVILLENNTNPYEEKIQELKKVAKIILGDASIYSKAKNIDKTIFNWDDEK